MKRNPKDQEQSHRKLGRRALVLGGLQLAFAGTLAMRMRYMQVEQADQCEVGAD